jgi:hypothetical protein
MFKQIKFKLLVIILALFLISCVSLDVDYLDDNYSDRVELAQKILGNESVYFDTSSYGKAVKNSIAIPKTEITLDRKLVGGGVNSLVEQFKLISDSYRKIAISGNISSDAVKVIILALSRVVGKKLTGIQILYIGEHKYLPEIKQAVEEKGADFIFSEMPETSI